MTPHLEKTELISCIVASSGRFVMYIDVFLRSLGCSSPFLPLARDLLVFVVALSYRKWSKCKHGSHRRDVQLYLSLIGSVNFPFLLVLWLNGC